MRLISNLNGLSHLACLKEQCEVANEIYLISPYLADDLGDLLADVDLRRLRSIHLISKLESLAAPEQIKQVYALGSFHDLADRNRNVAWTIRLNEKLHGKIYLFFRDGSPVSALVSSANLTWPGMRQNHEWGILVFDQEIICTLKTEVLSTVANAQELTDEILLQMMYRADDYECTPPAVREAARRGQARIDFSDILPLPVPLPVSSTLSTIWLKPEGTPQNPLPIDRDCSDPIRRLAFAVRPVGVKEGDLIISYAVGHVRVMSVCQAPQGFVNEPWGAEDRWPWKIDARNLQPLFGRNWFHKNISPTELANQFLRINPEGAITQAGSQSLGAFNFGADKLRLSTEYGSFLLAKINESLS